MGKETQQERHRIIHIKEATKNIIFNDEGYKELQMCHSLAKNFPEIKKLPTTLFYRSMNHISNKNNNDSFIHFILIYYILPQNILLLSFRFLALFRFLTIGSQAISHHCATPPRLYTHSTLDTIHLLFI